MVSDNCLPISYFFLSFPPVMVLWCTCTFFFLFFFNYSLFLYFSRGICRIGFCGGGIHTSRVSTDRWWHNTHLYETSVGKSQSSSSLSFSPDPTVVIVVPNGPGSKFAKLILIPESPPTTINFINNTESLDGILDLVPCQLHLEGYVFNDMGPGPGLSLFFFFLHQLPHLLNMMRPWPEGFHPRHPKLRSDLFLLLLLMWIADPGPKNSSQYNTIQFKTICAESRWCTVSQLFDIKRKEKKPKTWPLSVPPLTRARAGGACPPKWPDHGPYLSSPLDVQKLPQCLPLRDRDALQRQLPVPANHHNFPPPVPVDIKFLIILTSHRPQTAYIL